MGRRRERERRGQKLGRRREGEGGEKTGKER